MYCLFLKRRGKNAVFVVCGLQSCASRRIFEVGAGFRRARNGRENYFCFTEKRQEKSRQEKSPRARACKNYFFKNGLIALIAAPVLALSFNILFKLSLIAFVVLYFVAIFFISFISAALNCCGQFFKARSIVCGLSSFFVLFCFSTFVVVGEISSGSGSRLLRLF